jgi:hypothetical protein
MLGLTKAIARYNLRYHNNGLYAYAIQWIRGEISSEAKNWKKRGTGGETRIERWVYSHPYDEPQQIADDLTKKGIRCTAEQAAAAMHGISARRSAEHYSTTDSDYDEDDNLIGSRPAAAHDMYAMYDCYGSKQLSPQLFTTPPAASLTTLPPTPTGEPRNVSKRLAGEHTHSSLSRKTTPVSQPVRTRSSIFTRGSAASRSPPPTHDADASPNLASLERDTGEAGKITTQSRHPKRTTENRSNTYVYRY